MTATAGRGVAGVAITPILSARYRPEHLERIRAAAPWARLVNVSPEGLAQGPLDDVEVLLHGWLADDAYERLLARAPRLRWIHSASVGVERLLVPAAASRGIVLTNARGVFSRPVAEYVLMMVLAVSRRLPELLTLQAERTWQPLEGRELRDVTLGLVGFGSIGRAVADLAAPFGCRILAVRRDASPRAGDPPLPPNVEVGGRESLPELLAAADFVILALPLTADTERLLDAAALARMKRTAWLVNVARGRLVDEPALLRALGAGAIGGAVLDTFTEEPLPPTSPFYELPNVIATPLTSWSSTRVMDASIDLFCENLRRFAAGAPLVNVIDAGAGY